MAKYDVIRVFSLYHDNGMETVQVYSTVFSLI